jgi:hypothetical protein
VRIVKLRVETFQCIELVDIDFAAGLNVLYGPNDLGKSSLAWAIRAVLLLQHDSREHERFVSWYSDHEPRVELTLCDDTGRYWRVAKVFSSGTAGRSVLESSKDGRTFLHEAKGRQVDEKLRELLAWGIQPPGGRGGPRGLPRSFLTHVLLAEQDDVRKVLFDTSLALDSDESGRTRLRDALGALAQDPLFKQILDEAQRNVDIAFTPTGKCRTAAGSPFVESNEKIKAWIRARDALTEKVKETSTAEAALAAAAERREAVYEALEDARKAHEAGAAELSAYARHGTLRTQRDAAQRALQAAERDERRLAEMKAELERLRDARQRGTTDVAEARAKLEAAAERRARAATTRDQLLENPDLRRTQADLVAQQGIGQQAVRDAEHELRRRTDAMRAAEQVAVSVADAAARLAEATPRAVAAEDAAKAAAAQAAAARAALEDARRALREATAEDKARLRELERNELETREAKAVARHGRIQQELAIATAAGEAAAAVVAAEHALAAAASAEADAVAQVADAETTLAGLEACAREAVQLDILGRIRDARTALDLATRTLADADAERARGTELAARARELRGQRPADIPDLATLARLRELRERMRLAEARLGGGVTVLVRPKRSLDVTATTDGNEASHTDLVTELAMSARRSIALRICEVADVEIVAGEEDARRDAAAARAFWEAEGSATLRAHRCETLEQLEVLRHDADVRERDAAAVEREAEQVLARAEGRQREVDLATRQHTLRELEAELGPSVSGVLEQRLAGLGGAWAAALKQQRVAVTREMDAARSRGGDPPAHMARAAAGHEGAARNAEQTRAEAAQKLSTVGEPWRVACDRLVAEMAATQAELTGIHERSRTLTVFASGEERHAKERSAATEKLVEDADRVLTRANAEAQQSRDRLVATQTNLESARARARELDVDGVWRPALTAGVTRLPVDAWQASVAAATLELEQRRQLAGQLEAQRKRHDDDAREAQADAKREVDDAEAAFESITRRVNECVAAEQTATAAVTDRQLAIANLETAIAGANVDAARQMAQQLEAALAEYADRRWTISAADVAAVESTVGRLQADLRDADEEVARARGALEQVGGAVARQRLREVEEAHATAVDRERELHIEYDAWQLLVDVLRDSERTEGSHLGKALAGPVSRRFQQLTAGRYGYIELGPDLQATGLHAAGDRRDIGALSAGTQDQLATLLRLCIAEQLHSAIVLDDHLSQSDPDRTAWFSTTLRAAAQHNQIVLITCRPTEVLTPDELPESAENARVGADGLVQAVALTRIMRRFAAVAT